MTISTRSTKPFGVLEAYEALEAFAAEVGELSLILMMHASVPETLRPALLNLIKLNFVPEARGDGSVDADVLFSPVTETLSGGYYRIDAQTRRHCLALLRSGYRNEPVARAVRVASLISSYVDRLERETPPPIDTRLARYCEIQRWVALAFIKPDAAAMTFAAALKQALQLGPAAAVLRLGGVAAAIEISLPEHHDLLVYAQTAEALLSRPNEHTWDLVERLGNRRVSVGGIDLPPLAAVSERLAGGNQTNRQLPTLPASQVETRTQSFVRAVEDFADSKIRPEIAKNVDSLLDRVAAVIADEVSSIVKTEFDGWKSKRHSTVNGMKSGISEKIKEWLYNGLEPCLRSVTEDFVATMGYNLAENIKVLERQYNIPIGSLGAYFSLSCLYKPEDTNIADKLACIDITDGVVIGIVNNVGMIAGLVGGVVAYAVSATLASILAAILASNVAGWILLAGVGVFTVSAAGKVKQSVIEKISEWDLPQWVRDLVATEKIYKEIDERKPTILENVSSALKGDGNIGEKTVETLTEAFKASLRMGVSLAREGTTQR